jgi:hypothetical protein
MPTRKCWQAWPQDFSLSKAIGMGGNRSQCFEVYWMALQMGEVSLRSELALRSVSLYLHSQVLETVLPLASTSYSKAPQALFIFASFFDAVRKNSMPR